MSMRLRGVGPMVGLSVMLYSDSARALLFFVSPSNSWTASSLLVLGLAANPWRGSSRG